MSTKPGSIQFGVKQIDVNLQNIVSVGGKTGLLFGEITISTSGQNYTIKNVMKAPVIPFTNLVNETRNNATQSTQTNPQPVAANQDDVIAKIERLAKLKADGVLTDQEFQQQKQLILNG